MNEKKLDFSWDICGHHKQMAFLQSAITQQAVVHGYLFVGPSHIGKETVARAFTQSLLCHGGSGKTPCGSCAACTQFERGIHSDVYTVERLTDPKTQKLKSSISIDQIRDLKSKLQQGTLLGGYKVAMIPEAELLNTNAANALLKALEEPVGKTLIILIASSFDAVLPTIASRCQVVQFTPVATRDLEACLAQKTDTASARQWARIAAGRPGLAFNYIENPHLQDAYVHGVSWLLQSFSLPLYQRLGKVSDLFEWTADERRNQQQLEVVMSHWQYLLRDCLLFQSENRALLVNGNLIDEMQTVAQRFSVHRLIGLMNRLNESARLFTANITSKNIIENFLIHI